MKKFILLSIGFILLSNLSFSQYKINKTKYDYHTYTYQAGDPYNPSVAGLTSFLIPGLGQMLSGEGGRGAAFLGGYVGCLVVYGIGVGVGTADINNGGTGAAGGGLVIVGLLGAIGVDIWSIVDAVHVAKVNNLAFRDKNKNSLNLKVLPFWGNTTQTNNKLPIGLRLNITF